MAITFGPQITGNIVNTKDLSSNLQLKAARDFVEHTLTGLRKLEFKDIFPNEKAAPFQKEISGNGSVYSASNSSFAFGFYIKQLNPGTDSRTIEIVQKDMGMHNSRGGYNFTMESTGTWREIQNDMRTLSKEQNAVNVDPLCKADFHNVTIIAGSFAKFKDLLGKAQDKLSDYGTNGANPNLKDAIKYLDKALSTFGKISDKPAGEIAYKDGKLKYSTNQNITQLYGNPKQVEINNQKNENNFGIKLEPSHDTHTIEHLLEKMAKAKETLASHVEANKKVLGMDAGKLR